MCYCRWGLVWHATRLLISAVFFGYMSKVTRSPGLSLSVSTVLCVCVLWVIPYYVHRVSENEAELMERRARLQKLH